MKKFKTLLLTSLTAVLVFCCFMLAGCGAAGTYKFYAVEVLGVEYKLGDTFMGQEITAEDFEDITLNKDGTIVDMEGATWEEKDGKIVITMTYGEGEEAETETMELTKDGNKLIMERSLGASSMKVIYKK